MQPTGGFPGNAQNATIQQQQLLQLYQQYGHAMPHMQQQPYGLQQQQPQQQYVMPGASMAAMPRPASATPSPGMPQQQQPGSDAAGNPPRQSADGADGGDFDFDNIPSPTASPAGAGTGPAPAQQQQPQQQQQQQSMPFPGGQGAMGQAAQVAQQQQQQQASLQHQQQMQRQQQQAQQQQRAREEAMKVHQAVMQQQGPVAGRGPAAAAPAAQRMLPGSTAGMTSAQAALASADAAAAKSKKGPIVVGPSGALARPPGVGTVQGAPGLQQHHLQQQQQQQQQQLADAAKKRKRADSLLPPPPEDALSVEAVFARARMASGAAALAGLPGMPASVAAAAAAAAAAAGGAGTDGPSLSVDDILRRPEYQRGAAAAAAGKPGLGGAAGLKGGRGRDGRRDDESRVLPEFQLRRLMELQGLNKAFRMQPELQEQLTKLTEAFVSDAVDFGCALAARRRGATLRPSDLALFMQRSHHIYVPGFNKEYRQYKRPAASELHKARSVLVRKAQLHPQQQAAAVTGEGGGGGRAGGVRFSAAE